MVRRLRKSTAALLLLVFSYSQNLYAFGPAVSYPINPAPNALSQPQLPLETKQVTNSSYTNKGTSLGLDPRLTNLIGTGVSGAINGSFQAGVETGSAIIDGITNGLLRGTTSLGIEYLTQKADLDPLLGSLTSRAITGAIEGALGGVGIFQGIYEGFKQSVLNIARLGISGDDPWSQAQYLQRVSNFSKIIKDEGLVKAIESTATQVLTEDSISSILKSFSTVGAFFKDQFDNNKAEIVPKAPDAPADQPVYKKVLLGNGNYQIFSVDEEGKPKDLIEVRRGDQVLKGKFGKDPQGNFGLISGTISTFDNQGNLKAKQYIEGGWDIEDHYYGLDPITGEEALKLTMKPTEGSLGVTFDEFGQPRDAEIESGDGFTVTLLNGVPVKTKGPALSSTSNPMDHAVDSALLERLGLVSDDLAGIEMEIIYDPKSGKKSAQLTSKDSDPSAIDRLRAKIARISNSDEDRIAKEQMIIEIRSNYSNLLGPYTFKEMSEHKALVMNEIKANPNQIYVLHAKSDSVISRGIRVATKLSGDVDGVNHSALAFQNPADGKVYVIEITLGGLDDLKKTTNDVRVKTIDEWIGSDGDVLDIQAQQLPMSPIQTIQFSDRLGEIYVDYFNKTPKISYRYDYVGALAEGISVTYNEPINKRICSELVSDILKDAIGLQILSLDGDNYISPNELRRQVDEYLARTAI